MKSELIATDDENEKKKKSPRKKSKSESLNEIRTEDESYSSSNEGVHEMVRRKRCSKSIKESKFNSDTELEQNSIVRLNEHQQVLRTGCEIKYLNPYERLKMDEIFNCCKVMFNFPDQQKFVSKHEKHVVEALQWHSIMLSSAVKGSFHLSSFNHLSQDEREILLKLSGSGLILLFTAMVYDHESDTFVIKVSKSIITI